MESLIFSLPLFTVALLMSATYATRMLLSKQAADKKFRRRSALRLPPGPSGWPLVGNLPHLLFRSGEQHKLVNEWAKKFGDVFTFVVCGTRFVILSDVDIIRDTFINADINDMGPIPACNKALGISPEIEAGIIPASEGPAWITLRRFLISALRRLKLGARSFEDMADEEAERMVANFSSNGANFFDPASSVNVAVANITTRLTMGESFDYGDEDFVHLTEVANDVFESFGTGSILSLVPAMSHFPSEVDRRGEIAVAEMFKFIRKSVDRHREDFDPESEPSNLVDCFLREQFERRPMKENFTDLLKGVAGVFDDNNLLHFTWDILIGGWQTINTTVLWYLLLLAHRPDVQRRVQRELDRVVGPDRRPRLSDRDALPYTAATMAECYRVSRLLPIQIPHRARCDVQVGGYDVPAGSYVASNIQYLCSSPELWEEPDRFLPERFLDESGTFVRKLETNLLEFGVGRRACPGEQLSRTELFVFFTHIFHRFVIELPDDEAIDMRGRSGLTVNPLPFKIRATERH